MTVESDQVGWLERILKSRLRVVASESESILGWQKSLSVRVDSTGTITGLNLSGCEITDALFLQELTGLTELDLFDNRISDWSFLKSLIRLSRLVITSDQSCFIQVGRRRSRLFIPADNVNSAPDMTSSAKFALPSVDDPFAGEVFQQVYTVYPHVPGLMNEVAENPLVSHYKITPRDRKTIPDEPEIRDDWRSSPSELLAMLHDQPTSRDDLFEAILFAEIVEFDESQTRELVTRLFAFVREYRLSQDEDVKTAVGAAIRKLGMNLQDSQIDECADLFLPTDTDTLPYETELELAKVIVWRLTTAPVSRPHEYPKLESRLWELASDYLRPRLILQKNYASVAIQAALGVLLLNGQHADSVLKSVKALGIRWFTDLFQRRLGSLRKQLAGDPTSMDVTETLARFDSELQGPSDQGDTTGCQHGG